MNQVMVFENTKMLVWFRVNGQTEYGVCALTALDFSSNIYFTTLLFS